MCLVAVAPCLLHARASLTWWRQKNPRENHRVQDQLHFPLQGQGQEFQTCLPETPPSSYLSDSINGWVLQRLWSPHWCRKGMARPARMTSALFAKPTPKLLSRLFQTAFGPNYILAAAFPSGHCSPHFWLPNLRAAQLLSAPSQDLTVLTPTAVIALLAAKANRALPPKVAQEQELAIVGDTIYPMQLGVLLDVWPSYRSPLLLVSALFSTWMWSEMPWFQSLEVVILSAEASPAG